MGIENKEFCIYRIAVTLEQLGIKDDELEEVADRCTNRYADKGSLVKLVNLISWNIQASRNELFSPK